MKKQKCCICGKKIPEKEEHEKYYCEGCCTDIQTDIEKEVKEASYCEDY